MQITRFFVALKKRHTRFVGQIRSQKVAVSDKKKITYLLSDLDFSRFLGQKDKYMTEIREVVSSIILMLELSVYMQNS